MAQMPSLCLLVCYSVAPFVRPLLAIFDQKAKLDVRYYIYVVLKVNVLLYTAQVGMTCSMLKQALLVSLNLMIIF